MESEMDVPTLADRLAVLRRRWIYPALIAPACLVLALMLAFALPTLYRSSGTIILEPSSVPANMVQTVTSYADQQFELVQRRLMTPDNLLELVKSVDPYPDRPDLTAQEKAQKVADATEVERVDPVTLETLAESNAFSLHYYNPDPQRAAAVAKELVQLFLDYNQKTRSERAAGMYHFLLTESEKLGASIRGMEARLAEFKTQYGAALPEAQSRNLTALDSARQDYDGLNAQIRLVQERASLLELQLSDTPSTLMSAATDTRAELATLKAELAEARKRYTPEHPDVKRLERAIQTFATGPRGASQGGKPDNPEYLRISSQLRAARGELAALQARASRASSQIDSYSRSLQLTPNVEREYSQLVRNYQIAQEQFRNIQNKLRDAQLAQSLVSESEAGDRFTLIRTPRVSSSPASPNRLGIILLGIVLGGALGIAAAMAAEMSDPTVRSSHDLQVLTGHSMLAAVPMLRNRADEQERRVRLTSVAVTFGLALVAIGVLVLRTVL